MSKVSKYIGKFIKAYADIIWDSSKQPVRGLIQTIKKSPKVLDDIASIVVNPDLDNLVDNALDIVNDLDVIGTQAKLTKDTVRYAKNRWRQFSDEVKQIRSQPSTNQKDIVFRESEDKEMKKTNTKSNKANYEKGSHKAKTTSGTTKTKYANTISGVNHPEWYLKGKPLPNLIGINISNRQNVINDYMNKYRIDDGVETSKYSIPSVLGLNVSLTIPKSATNDWKQAVNFLYQNLRATNAGATNYTAGHLSNYIHHVRCMEAGLGMLYRAISVAFEGTFYDAMSPQVYFANSGLDYDSFVLNLANARDLYFRLASLRSRIAPLDITLFDRTRWLFTNIFKDSDDAKAQNYMFFTDRVYYYDRTKELKQVRFGQINVDSDVTGATFDEFAGALVTLFDDFQNNDKYQTIAGDILKAYENSAIVTWPDQVQKNVRIYDEHVLTQIQNATLSLQGSVTIGYGLDSDGYIFSTAVEEISSVTISGDTTLPSNNIEVLNTELINPIYNANTDVVEPGRLLSSTRLMVSRHAENAQDINSPGFVYYDTFGTEILEAIHCVFEVGSSNKYGLAEVKCSYIANNGYISSDGYIQMYLDIPIWSWFDYFPLVRPETHTYTTTDDIPQWVISLPVFDFNNFGIATKQNLDTYNAICVLSMLYTPYVYKAVNTKVLPNV